MRAPSPTYTAGSFQPLHDELVSVLGSLDREDRTRPTLEGYWHVRDVVAHLLDGDSRRLSFHRDGRPVPSSPDPTGSRDRLGAPADGAFDITQAGVSQHLRVLRECGFASVRVDGPRHICSVDVEPLQTVDAWLDRFRSFWEPKLNALERETARRKEKRRS